MSFSREYYQGLPLIGWATRLLQPINTVPSRKNNTMAKFLAHSKNGDGTGVVELLKTHLDRVANRAADFSLALGFSQQARVAGLLHDLGKYSDQFQRRLLPGSNERGRDHSSAGAFLATQCYKAIGLLPALAIEGHHIGLQQLLTWKDIQGQIGEKLKADAERPRSEKVLTESDCGLLIERFRDDGFVFPKLTDGICPTGTHDLADMLDVRMLFSTLVDADFLETEAHFNGDASQPRRERSKGSTLAPKIALEAVRREIDKLASPVRTEAAPELLVVRKMLYEDCCNVATTHQPGIFTLSAPTGAGKTLSMLAFALRHAVKHDLRRVIVVMPYLSIIDQTASIYRDIFSERNGFAPNFVIEDHSNVRSDSDDDHDSVTDGPRLDRLLAENWDAPIVLTTSVQCLESLMAHRPSACRKLHRMAKSVILFDEVQSLPRELAVPTLATLSRLCERFGSSVVFSTATQPAFDHLDEFVAKQAIPGWKPTEITSNAAQLFAPSASRIKVCWRHDEAIAWESLADEIESGEGHAGAKQVLCILNVKRHAQHLATLLHDREVEGTLHLSTNMCTEHRMAVMKTVKQKLEGSQPVRLIATQCIEAGVDIDFPVVYRAFGPLDSIAQAAGRCNRNGKLKDAGTLHVFKPEDAVFPQGGYKQAVETTRSFLKRLGAPAHKLDSINILNNPKLLRNYYEQLYELTGTGKEDGDLARAIEECDFGDVAKNYRLIDDNSINILVPYDELAFKQLCDETEQDEFHNPKAIRSWIRKARPHAVSLYRPRTSDSPLWNYIEPIQFSRKNERSVSEATWFIAIPSATYDPLLGWCDGDDSWVC